MSRKRARLASEGCFALWGGARIGDTPARMMRGLASVALVTIAACSEPKVEVTPIPVPETSAFEPSVRTKLTESRAELDRIIASKPSNRELGNAYGEMAMVYHAQDLLKAAEIAYDNARKLSPREIRWPYLEGHMFNDSARPVEALRMFEVALAIDSNDLPTLISLGQVYFQQGELDKAQKLFEKALPNKGGKAAAETGLGKIAMSRRDYRKAARHFEEALKLWPGATRLYQPLSVAYRALGENAKADEAVARFDITGVEPSIPDAAADALASKVAASKVLLRRGQREGKAGRFDLAEVAFRAAFAADPTNAEVLANLGISLANLGRIEEAQKALEDSVKMDDKSAVAQMSLGVVYDRQGMDQQAAEHYENALRLDPENAQAAAYLADVRMRQGKPDKAIELYEKAQAASSGSMRMQLAIAMANIKAGHYLEARKILEPMVVAQPNNGEAINALARLLATSPQPSVRDGTRALQLSKALFEQTKSPDVGQTYAMALAENGQYAEAATLQNETMIVYERMKVAADKAFLTRNLERYQKQQPTREGWSESDSALMPRSPAAQLARPAAS